MRDSVGQTSGATQRCLNPEFSEELRIRDAHGSQRQFQQLRLRVDEQIDEWQIAQR
jgi:hypothetical protein